jgi:hypothetical protein
VGLQVGEPEEGGGGVGFVGELAELFAVGLEPAVEGEAEDALDSLEVAASMGDLGAAEGDGAGAEVLDVDREYGKRAAVAADQVGDGLFRVKRETVGHGDSIG